MSLTDGRGPPTSGTVEMLVLSVPPGVLGEVVALLDPPTDVEGASPCVPVLAGGKIRPEVRSCPKGGRSRRPTTAPDSDPAGRSPHIHPRFRRRWTLDAPPPEPDDPPPLLWASAGEGCRARRRGEGESGAKILPGCNRLGYAGRAAAGLPAPGS